MNSYAHRALGWQEFMESGELTVFLYSYYSHDQVKHVYALDKEIGEKFFPRSPPPLNR